MTDEQAQEKAKKRRRELLLLLFALLLATTEDSVRQAAAAVASGQIDPYHFGAAMGAILAPAHAHAAYLGRQLAGQTAPFGQADVQFGRTVADDQRQYLVPFVDAIGRGQYSDEHGVIDEAAVTRRALYYVKRLLGTANLAWVRALPVSTVLRWDDRGDAAECDDCRELAKNSPYTPETLPTVPGNCDTECLFNCKCRLYVDGPDGAEGEEGFVITA